MWTIKKGNFTKSMVLMPLKHRQTQKKPNKRNKRINRVDIKEWCYLGAGRKRTTEYERDTIKQFNALIKEHSLDAVKNIVKISNRAMDENVRLKANVWIAEKLVGKNYSIIDMEGNNQDNNINIVLNVKNATINDSEAWEEDNSDLDDWGKDLYTPSH